jgi:hypothetical protein
MANPHIGIMKALNKDIHEKGWTIKKGRLFMGATRRATTHRQTDKGAKARGGR